MRKLVAPLFGSRATILCARHAAPQWRLRVEIRILILENLLKLAMYLGMMNLQILRLKKPGYRNLKNHTLNSSRAYDRPKRAQITRIAQFVLLTFNCVTEKNLKILKNIGNNCVTEKVCFVTDFLCLEMMMSIAFGSKVVLLKKKLKILKNIGNNLVKTNTGLAAL